ncbi:hypothetical protein L3Y34_016030 [Caenorhabditis briggsae]|uniref:Uncharacterized protein n=1 Tax=Caenorhabditis briggsae TaxID=6238 RepID=A0AAE9DY86_CAEBR|nr:hypothetical protein L3Y34_016030 [Caenorhabditis briggsae]
MSWINYVPGWGAAKGVVQCLMGDTTEGVQAMKDSVKIPAVAVVVEEDIGCVVLCKGTIPQSRKIFNNENYQI